MSPTVLNFHNAALRVGIDFAQDGYIAGKIYGQRLHSPVDFKGFSGLFLTVQSVLQIQDFPQSFQRFRVFSKKTRQNTPLFSTLNNDFSFMEKAAVANSFGLVKTFSLNITSRRNSTWQGLIDFLDGSSPVPFQSGLELIQMIAKIL